jgi:hypothetical protein
MVAKVKTKVTPLAQYIKDSMWRAPEGQPLRLDLGCGDNKRDGFLGVDLVITASTNFVHDLTIHPWPCEDATVDEVHCSHFFEHLDGRQRLRFMESLFRVMKVGAKATMITPYWNSMRAVQDPTHAWPPVCEASYLYFNKQWREQNKLTHGAYQLFCDFDFGYGYGLDQELQMKNSEMQQFAIKNFSNAITDLHVTLTKR